MKREKTTLKSYFQTGDKPTQDQYEDLIDSLRHLNDTIPVSEITFEGYSEENTRPSDLLVKLGDYDDLGHGTKIILNDADEKITLKGTLVFPTPSGGNTILEMSSHNESISLQLPSKTGKLISDTADNVFTGTQSFDESVSFDGFVEFGSDVTFQNPVQFVDEITTHGTTSNSHIKLKNNAWLWSQYSPTHDELRLNSNTVGGWDFYNQTQTNFANIRAGGAEFHGLITANKGIIINNEDSIFNASVIINDEVQINGSIIHNGPSSFTGASNFNDVVTIDADLQVNQAISTPTDTHLSLLPNGTGNIYLGNPINGNSIYHYSNLNDGKYTTFTHNTFQSVFDSTHAAGFRFNKGIQVHGDIRTIGNFVSSDGTPGYNGSFTVGTFSITVKDGLITGVVDIF